MLSSALETDGSGYSSMEERETKTATSRRSGLTDPLIQVVPRGGDHR
jgi:hypothetical protein